MKVKKLLWVCLCSRHDYRYGSFHGFSLLFSQVKEIGGSPAMILASDMSNTIPDEKVSSFVSND